MSQHILLAVAQLIALFVIHVFFMRAKHALPAHSILFRPQISFLRFLSAVFIPELRNMRVIWDQYTCTVLPLTTHNKKPMFVNIITWHVDIWDEVDVIQFTVSRILWDNTSIWWQNELNGCRSYLFYTLYNRYKFPRKSIVTPFTRILYW